MVWGVKFSFFRGVNSVEMPFFCHVMSMQSYFLFKKIVT